MIFINLIKGKILFLIFLGTEVGIVEVSNARERMKYLARLCAMYLFIINDEIEVLKGQVQSDK